MMIDDNTDRSRNVGS